VSLNRTENSVLYFGMEPIDAEFYSKGSRRCTRAAWISVLASSCSILRVCIGLALLFVRSQYAGFSVFGQLLDSCVKKKRGLFAQPGKKYEAIMG
jgi:hypothetical protein